MDLAVQRRGTDGRFGFGFASGAAPAVGLDVVLQSVLVELLSDYDVLTDRGSGLLRELRTSAQFDDARLTDVAQAAVRRVETTLRTRYVGRAVPPAERLTGLRLTYARISPTRADAWLLGLEVSTGAGTTTVELPIGA